MRVQKGFEQEMKTVNMKMRFFMTMLLLRPSGTTGTLLFLLVVAAFVRATYI